MEGFQDLGREAAACGWRRIHCSASFHDRKISAGKMLSRWLIAWRNLRMQHFYKVNGTKITALNKNSWKTNWGCPRIESNRQIVHVNAVIGALLDKSYHGWDRRETQHRRLLVGSRGSNRRNCTGDSKQTGETIDFAGWWCVAFRKLLPQRWSQRSKHSAKLCWWKLILSVTTSWYAGVRWISRFADRESLTTPPVTAEHHYDDGSASK